MNFTNQNSSFYGVDRKDGHLMLSMSADKAKGYGCQFIPIELIVYKEKAYLNKEPNPIALSAKELKEWLDKNGVIRVPPEIINLLD